MSRPVRASAPAAEELAEAVRWYEARRAGLGAEFFDAVVATATLIEARPEVGTSISADAGTRRMLVRRFPYQIVYRVRATDIVIVAFAHAKRRPGYWRNRS